AVGQAVLARPRLRRDHAQGVRAQGPGRPRRPGDLAALHRPRRARRRQVARLHPAHEPAAAHLARHRHRGDGEADGGDRRRLAAVPDDFCDEMSLVGPAARIRERYRAWADSGITGLTLVTDQPETMELMAGLAR